MPTFQTFSDIVNIGAILLFFANAILFTLFLTNNRFKKFIKSLPYNLFIFKIFAISLFGIVVANIYDFVYGDAPCIYCWYARIFFYGIFLLSAVELAVKTRVAHIFLGVFAAFATFISTYHYSFHFRRYVLGDIFMPCSTNPFLPDCTNAKIVSFGFGTLPMVGMIGALALLLTCYLASQAKK